MEKRFECWDDSEEAPEVGDGEHVRSESAEGAALYFADVDSMDDNDRMRVCVRPADFDGPVRCFEVHCVKRADVREVAP